MLRRSRSLSLLVVAWSSACGPTEVRDTRSPRTPATPAPTRTPTIPPTPVASATPTITPKSGTDTNVTPPQAGPTNAEAVGTPKADTTSAATAAATTVPSTPGAASPLDEALARIAARTRAFSPAPAAGDATTLHERSLGNGTIESLESLAADPAGVTALRDAGIEVASSDASQLTLAFSRPATLAFGRFADTRKVILATNGHAVTLVGHDFSAVSVTSTAPGGAPAGDVALVATGTNLPALDLRGAAGADGKDAQCPIGLEGCLSANPPAFPDAPEPALVETTWEEVETVQGGDPAFVAALGEIRSKMDEFFPQAEREKRVPPPAEVHVLAARDIVTRLVPYKLTNAEFIFARTTGVIRKVATFKNMLRKKDSGPTAGRDGQVIPPAATPAPGARGGQARIASLQAFPEIADLQLAGGAGGRPGRAGLVRPGHGTKALVVPLKHSMRWHVDIDEAWDMTSRREKLQLEVKPLAPVERAKVAVSVPLKGYVHWFAGERTNGRVVEYPAGKDGAEAQLPAAAPAPKGADGALVRVPRPSGVGGFLDLVPPVVPLPEACARALSAGAREGTLGL